MSFSLAYPIYNASHSNQKTFPQSDFGGGEMENISPDTTSYPFLGRWVTVPDRSDGTTSVNGGKLRYTSNGSGSGQQLQLDQRFGQYGSITGDFDITLRGEIVQFQDTNTILQNMFVFMHDDADQFIEFFNVGIFGRLGDGQMSINVNWSGYTVQNFAGHVIQWRIARTGSTITVSHSANDGLGGAPVVNVPTTFTSSRGLHIKLMTESDWTGGQMIWDFDIISISKNGEFFRT